MKLVNCVALTRGDLQGRPSFSAFEEIKVTLNQVNRGDLFIASCGDDVALAIKRGAYGVMYDFDYEPNDDEIAWIRVRCIKSSAIVIAKYLLLKRQIRFSITDEVTFEILKKINKDARVAFLTPDDLPALFNAIKNDEKCFYISYDDKYFHDLTSDSVESYFASRDVGFSVVGETMFETTVMDSEQETALRVPSFMLRFLKNGQKMLLDLGLEHDITDVKFTKFFEPIFVDDSLKEREFGKTSRVVIFSEFESTGFLRDSIDFVKQKGKWGRCLFLLPSRLIGFEHDDTLITYFGSDEELFDIIEDSGFNFAFLLDGDRKMISKDKKEQLSLF